MPYLGKSLAGSSSIRRFNVTSSTSATHTLTWAPPTEQSIIVSINGVKQHEDAYSISGTTLTLTNALVATDKMEVIGINDVGTTVTAAQGSVNTDKLADDAVTTAKIANDQVTTAKIADDQITSAKLANAINITSGNSLTIDSGATITNNGTVSGFADAVVAFDAVKSGSSTSISKATWTKIPLDTVNVDTDSAFASNKFTVPSGKGGKYFLSGQFQGNEVAGYVTGCNVSIYVNGASVADSAFNFYNNNIIDQKQTTVITCRVIELADGDYVELYGYVNTNGTTPIYYGALTRLSGHRLGD